MEVSLGCDGGKETVTGRYIVDETELARPPDSLVIRAKIRHENRVQGAAGSLLERHLDRGSRRIDRGGPWPRAASRTLAGAQALDDPRQDESGHNYVVPFRIAASPANGLHDHSAFEWFLGPTLGLDNSQAVGRKNVADSLRSLLLMDFGRLYGS